MSARKNPKVSRARGLLEALATWIDAEILAEKQKAITARDALWLRHAEDIRREGISNFENPMLALAARVSLSDLNAPLALPHAPSGGKP